MRREHQESSMGHRQYRVLHLRKQFERNLPIFINFVRGVDNDRFTHLVCYIGKEPGYKNMLADLGYEVIYLGFEKTQMEFFNPLIVVRLAKILREKKIDILHCQKQGKKAHSRITSGIRFWIRKLKLKAVQ